ncbi:6681_t:CDS:2, partial [Acaulospora morrowiae]
MRTPTLTQSSKTYSTVKETLVEDQKVSSQAKSKHICQALTTRPPVLLSGTGQVLANNAIELISPYILVTRLTRQVVRFNAVNVEMLPDWLYAQVFPNQVRDSPPHERVSISIHHLVQQGLYNKETEEFPPINYFNLPKLCGDSIAEHFWKIGEQQAYDSRELAKRFAESELPDMPEEEKWVFNAGWTRYRGGDMSPEPVEYPEESALCFDVETLLSDSDYALIACAASPQAWYVWLSPRLIEYRDRYLKKMESDEKTDCESVRATDQRKHKSDKDIEIDETSCNEHKIGSLIPIGNCDKERIIVGHNVGFDRARIREEYHRDKSCNRYLDTMALHVAVSGLCTQQRPSWIKHKKATEENDTEYLSKKSDFQCVYDVSSINNLRDVYKFHCQEELNKSERNLFVDGSLEDIVKDENLPRLITYCARDVRATHRVFKVVFPRFLEVCPHPVSFAGMICMGNMFLTTNRGWDDYIESAESIYRKQLESIEL